MNMMDSQVAKYTQKLQELVDSITSKIAATQVGNTEKFKIFGWILYFSVFMALSFYLHHLDTIAWVSRRHFVSKNPIWRYQRFGRLNELGKPGGTRKSK